MMRKYTYVIIAYFFSFTALLFGQGQLMHSPPKDVYVGEPIPVEVSVLGNISSIYRVLLFYRITGDPSFFEIEMLEENGSYSATIPGYSISENGLDYLIIMQFNDRSLLAFPEVDPYNVPMYLPAKHRPQSSEDPFAKGRKAEKGIPANVVILSPQEGEIVVAAEALIAISLFNAPDIDLKTVRVEIDDRRITKFEELSPDLIMVKPRDLNAGVHTIRLNMKNTAGEAYASLSWKFSVVKTIEQAQRDVNTSGNITLTGSSDKVRGITQNIQNMRTNLNFSYSWLRFNGKAYVTSLEDPQRQPRNRLSASIYTPVMEFQIGDVFPTFSELGMNGKRVRGVEAHLKLRFVNLHLVTGEMEKAIRGGVTEIPDTLADGLHYRRSGYTFKRNVLAVRPYFGSGQHFQIGFSLIKALDDTLSVDRVISGFTPAPNARIDMVGYNRPQDNLVVGGDMTIAFDKKRLLWKNDFAMSLLNRDISNGALALDELDTFMPGDTLQDNTLTMGGYSLPLEDFPFDPQELSRYFIINENMSPLLPIVPDTSGAIGIEQIWNMPSTAIRSALVLNYLQNYVVVKYHRVGPEFYSLANPFMRNDVTGLTVSDKIRLFGNKLYITLNYDQMNDNLAQNKATTTSTSSLYAAVLLTPGDGLPTVNFDTRHYSRFNDIVSMDTTRYYSVMDPTVVDSIQVFDRRENNLTIRQNITLSHTLKIAGTRNFVSVRYGTSERSDQVKNRLEGYRFNTISTTMFRFGLNSVFPIPLNLNFDVSKNTNESSLMDKPYEYLTIGVRGQYDFLRGNLSTILGYRNIAATGSVEYTQRNLYSEIRLKFLRNHRIDGRLNYDHIDDQIGLKTYNDLSFRLSYSIVF